MCGIVGALDREPVDPVVLERMRDALEHRGPDRAGAWYSDDRTVALGHRRLSIIDLSSEADQPFRSPDGRYVLVFNGEVYNFRTLRAELERAGCRFRTSSDTEVLLEGYRAWGRGVLDRLHGMFAFAVWDSVERRLFCARDRVGEKPFYYTVSQGAFLFASELKALVEWSGFARRIHMPAVVDFLTFSFIPDPSCIFEGCRKLPPGHYLDVELPPGEAPRVPEPVQWWDFDLRPDLSLADWGPSIRDTLIDVARDMAYADVPVGTFLSGGVDSSSVTAALSRQDLNVTAFTIGFDEQAYDERPWARSVVERYGVPWQERAVHPDDIQPVLTRLQWHYDEPFGDYSYLPTFYVCQEARREITVALSGDGADEVFAGYARFQRAANVQRLRRIPGYALAAAGARAASRLPVGDRRRRTLLQYGGSMAEMLTDALTLGWSRKRLLRVARGDLRSTLDDYSAADVVNGHLARVPPEEYGLVDAMRYLDLKLTLAGDILVKVDRASMAVSLEVRPVYLHPALLDLAARLPSTALASPEDGKRALKSALEPWLPRDLLYRKKMGFHMPLNRWVGERLPDWVAQARRSTRLSEWFEPGFFDRLHREHRTGRADHTAMLHSLMFLAGWLETWSTT